MEIRDQGVHYLRNALAREPGNRLVWSMVERLRARSAEFAEGWDSHHVAFQQFGTRVLNHPQVGRLAIDFQGLQPIGHDRIRIVVYTAADDAESSERLARLLNP